VNARLLALGALCIAASSAAQQPTFRDTTLDKLVGEWVMQGMMQGKETTHDISVEWVNQHQYLCLHEVSRETKPDGTPAYEATVYIGWDASTKEYAILWLDVYGSITEESLGYAKSGQKNLAFLFTYRDGTKFHTTFTPGATAETWTMTMDNESKQGTLKPFARVTLTRKPSPVPTR
jgi:hypothetical protein